MIKETTNTPHNLKEYVLFDKGLSMNGLILHIKRKELKVSNNILQTTTVSLYLKKPIFIHMKNKSINGMNII